MITEALKLLFRKDDDFRHWADQHTNNHNKSQAGRKYQSYPLLNLRNIEKEKTENKSIPSRSQRYRIEDLVTSENRLFKIAQTAHLGQVRLIAKETQVTARAGVWKRKREDLMNRRTALFKRYEKSPGELNLALEIKSIDDQIAECTHQIECENRTSARSSGVAVMCGESFGSVRP